MPKIVPPLTDLALRKARPAAQPYKLFDGGGLYLEVTPAGGRFWKLKYRNPKGRENKLSLGRYPEVSLAAAREQRDAARAQLAAGLDPAEVREKAAMAARQAAEITFEAVARDWHAVMRGQWQPHTAQNILHRLESDVFPLIGGVPIGEVNSRDILHVGRQMERRGALEVARRVVADVSRVFVFAFHSGLVDRNPAAMLGRVLMPRQKGHFAAIQPDQLPAFLKALSRNEACMGPVVRIAMRLMLLVFVRTSELIETPWTEIDFEHEDWIIPWSRMKRGKRKVNPDRNDHQVCPSRQVMELLRELHAYTGGAPVLFPNMRDPDRPMSNMALLKALERMGYKGDMTGHGFRALAMSTLKERLGYRHEVMDRQLAHAQSDKLESAYDRARYLAERCEMMQRWADYLEEIERTGRMM